MLHLIRDSDPDINCGLIRLWVIGRQFPNATDYWDGNWLHVIVNCESQGVNISIQGPFLHLGEIVHWRNDLMEIIQGKRRLAELPTVEPNLRLKLSANQAGDISAKSQLTPNANTQTHSFEFALAKSALHGLSRQCNSILERYPLRESSASSGPVRHQG